MSVQYNFNQFYDEKVEIVSKKYHKSANWKDLLFISAKYRKEYGSLDEYPEEIEYGGPYPEFFFRCFLKLLKGDVLSINMDNICQFIAVIEYLECKQVIASFKEEIVGIISIFMDVDEDVSQILRFFVLEDEDDKRTLVRKVMKSNNPNLIYSVFKVWKDLINIKDKSGNAPIHYAFGNPDLKNILLRFKNIDLSIKNNDDLSAKDIFSDLEDEQIMYEEEEQITEPKKGEIENKPYKRYSNNVYDRYLRNPIHIAAHRGDEMILEKELEEYSFNINDSDMFDKTPLYLAIENIKPTCAAVLIKHSSVDLLKLYPKDETLLHLAARKNDSDSLRAIIEKDNSLLNAQDSEGKTPLILSIQKGQENSFEFLNQCPGVDFDIVDNDGNSVLHIATLTNRKDIVPYLLNHKTIKTNEQNKAKQTPLRIAIDNDFKEIAKMLIQHHSTNLSLQFDFKRTYMHIAALKGRKEILKYLIDNKADPNSKDENEWTALHLVCDSNKIESVEFLLSCPKININAEEKLKRTPLHLAVLKRHREVIELLLKNRADLYRKDINMKSPFDYAKKDPRLIELFMSYYKR